MSKKVLTLLGLVCFFYLGQAQNTISSTFLEHKILTVDVDELLTKVNTKSASAINLKIDDYDMDLIPSDFISPDYKSMTDAGPFINNQRAIPLKGFNKNGGTVRLTIAENFIYGFIEDGESIYYIEPASYYDTNAKAKEFIIYESKSIIQGEEKTCGVTSTAEKEIENISSKIVDLCYDVDYPVAADFSYVDKYGGAAGAEAKIIAVINMVNTDYDDSFADQLTFILTGTFFSTSTANDPWTVSTNVDNLLNSYISWANSYWGPNGISSDVSSFWSNRDFDGSTIGYAPVGAVCTGSGHNILQDFSTNANQIRVLTSHELGHNFDASHDASGSTTIMAPSVSNVTDWSTASVNSVNAHVNSRNCLTSCIPSGETPTINFGTINSTVFESGTSGSSGACELDFIQHSVSLSLSNTPDEDINVTVNISGSSTASQVNDFSIQVANLTFTAGGSIFKQVNFNIFEDHIAESNETIQLTYSVTQGTVNFGPNTTHEITIVDANDFVTDNCCTGYNVIEYGTYNYNASTIFLGLASDTRSRAIYTVEDLTAAGVSAGPIDAIALAIVSKNSTIPYQNFRIGLTHTANDDLTGMSFIATDQHFLADYTTALGLNLFEFDTPFVWNGTSNLYIQWCYDNTSSSSSDLIQHTIPPVSTSVQMTRYQAFNGTTGCDIPSSSENNYTVSIQPRLFFVDNLGAQAETVIGADAQSNILSGQTANLYSATNKIICSIENSGNTNIACIDATIESAGNGKSSAGFGTGSYSDKTYEINGDNNSLYTLTLYYTDAELATWGSNSNDLNIVRSTVPLNMATASDVEIIAASEVLDNIGGNDQKGYVGQFSNFSYFALTDVAIPEILVNEFADVDLVIMDSNSGLVFKSSNDIDYMVQATIGNTFSSTPAVGPTMLNFEEGEVLLNSASKGIIFKKPGVGYLKLTVDNSGTIQSTPLTVLPSENIQIFNGHITVEETGKSLIVKNGNGDCFKLNISALGVLSATELANCP